MIARKSLRAMMAAALTATAAAAVAFSAGSPGVDDSNLSTDGTRVTGVAADGAYSVEDWPWQ